MIYTNIKMKFLDHFVGFCSRMRTLGQT